MTATPELRVRAVLGDLVPAQLGVCDAHDHLFFTSSALPGEELAEAEAARRELGEFAQAGGGAVVHWTPFGCGRAERMLAEISRQTGVHVIAATGLHQPRHYSDGGALGELVRSDLGELFTSELLDGMRPDPTEPPTATGIRAGVIKVAGQYHRLLDYERAVFAAAAEAHGITGAPICVHTELGTHGAEILEFLSERGVEPRHVVLGHLNRNPDVALHRELAQAGAFLAYDGPSRHNHATDWRLLELIGAMAESGHGDRLLLGADTTMRSAMRAHGGGPGMGGLVGRLRDRITRELGDDLARAMFIENPARAFAAPWTAAISAAT